MITISGGVIVKQNGSMVTYQMKCNICGTLAPDSFTVTLTRGVIEISTHSCPSCRNIQLVKIRIVDVEKIISP